MKIKTLDEALERIDELEREVSRLKKENKELLERKMGGRRRHIDILPITRNCKAIQGIG